MAGTSGSFNQTLTRDAIITEAFRICQVVGLGEAPNSTAISEATVPLNNIMQELSADGMPIWAIKNTMTASLPLTPVANTNSYTIGVAATINTPAPLKILQAWRRDISVTPNVDYPVQIITREEYFLLPDKNKTSSAPTHLYYDQRTLVSGQDNTANEPRGTIYIYPTPDATAAANMRIYFTYQAPFADFDATGDLVDLPREWYRAICWLLAADISYSNGLPFAERAMIEKKAQAAKANALSFGSQEGSMFLQPEPNWHRY